MAKTSTSPKKTPTFADRLRRLRWLFIGGETKHERDVFEVVNALAAGDELLARKLAEVVEAHHKAHERADDLGVREHWYQELAAWDGIAPASDEMARRFVGAMAAFLSRYEGQGEFFADTPERVEAVRLAFDRTLATRFHARNPGRSLLSAGLMAMGVPRDEVDDMLDVFRKK